MLQIILQRAIAFYQKKNRWWLPLITGLPFLLCLPPFNHELHPVFSFFPFLNFIALIPLFYFSLQKPRGRAILHVFLYSYSVALGQVFWLVCVKIEGLWALIVLGMALLAGFVALFYCAAGMAFRWCYRTFPRFYLLLFPACWILIDYSRTLGELTFPWGYLGYSFTPLLPISQFASLTGVWGLTYLIVAGNLLVWEIIVGCYRRRSCRAPIIRGVAFCAVMGCIALWGWARMGKITHKQEAKVAVIQTAIDQLHWESGSLDTSFAVMESLVYSAAKSEPALIVGPESALLCYLSRQRNYRNRVCGWADSAGAPIILGALDWENAPGGSAYDYLVYNTAFLIRPKVRQLLPYRKIKLVPFSEAFPYETKFPLLSRVNLGEADFQRGKEETVFVVNDSLHIAPFICYEIIYPRFVQRRLRHNANLIVHITNDGWFGRTSGPYQHATMARMRSIENGVAMARCAITGVSMFVDPAGRVLGETELYERTVLKGKLPLCRAETLYARFGDWFVKLCAAVAIGAAVIAAGRWTAGRRRMKKGTVPCQIHTGEKSGGVQNIEPVHEL